METQSITQTSKTKTILMCCLITFVIAVTVSTAGKINVHDFIMNILDWQSI
jgi:hypothetical protein